MSITEERNCAYRRSDEGKQMRERKYKAWDREEKVMRDVAGIHWGINVIEFYDEDIASGTYDLDEYDMVDYIGSKDKDDNEIYQDDIVEDCFIHADPDNVDHKYLDGVGRGVVVWYKNGFWIRVVNLSKIGDPNFGYRYHQIVRKWIKVIGNVHKNPELIDLDALGRSERS